MTAYWGKLDGSNTKEQKVGEFISISSLKDSLRQFVLNLGWEKFRPEYKWDKDNKCIKCTYGSYYKALYIYDAEFARGELVGNS